MDSDLKLAYDAITGKYSGQTTAWDYYLGNQPLVYANERLREIFAGVQVKFIENWCGVVVDSLKERMQLDGFSVPDEAQALMDDIWERNELNLESDDLHEAALVTGEAYLIAWPNESGQVEIYYNDPRLCQAFYQADRPRVMRFAAKMWAGSDGLSRMTLTGSALVAFTAVLHFPHPTSKKIKREHRTVCLPDYQGVGIGNAMSDYIASLFRGLGFRYMSQTSHPAMIRARAKSKNWKMIRDPDRIKSPHSATSGRRSWHVQEKRITASFEFIGEPLPRDEAKKVWNI